ncbi:hypothetical protein BDA99DRAFT_576288 [Phascolomyces articulosus]|uniref:Uncharacterized protein n=1 Tax=Phascolomyces articulosus TaxID=60185 RepID=A0AAD5P8A0_9FUNG|nr:hypothetical protein BDA99DRAFT_576288 [Phascolomyces articulosus]
MVLHLDPLDGCYHIRRFLKTGIYLISLAIHRSSIFINIILLTHPLIYQAVFYLFSWEYITIRFRDNGEKLFFLFMPSMNFSQKQQKTPKHPMTQSDAARIQSHADKTGTNQDFKSRAQSTADSRANQESKNRSGQRQ